MFKFFQSKTWALWAWVGSAVIVVTTWYKVQLDVQINEWFGGFYNLIQKALPGNNAVAPEELISLAFTFVQIAAIYIAVAVCLDFFVKHWTFRWRTSMTEFFTSHWGQLRHIEGASQRIQEDTWRFSKITESLGIAFVRAIMTLFAFLPILWSLSVHVTELPWIGPVSQALVYVAILSALSGTVLLALVGFRLPGLEYNNQMVEAAYRKELVYGEDSEERAQPKTLAVLYKEVRWNHFQLFFHYLYFDVCKWSYLQFSVIIPYIALAPTIASGALTLGVMQQIIRAFGKVEDSFQYLVNSWSTIVELMSIFKRLRAFERELTS